MFEPTRLGDCDGCFEFDKINEFSLCQRCDLLSNSFSIAAGRVRFNGGTQDDAYKAGNAAMDAIIKQEDL